MGAKQTHRVHQSFKDWSVKSLEVSSQAKTSPSRVLFFGLNTLMYYEVKLKTVEDVTLPSAERCSENNFRIISRKSKESSAAEKDKERKAVKV